MISDQQARPGRRARLWVAFLFIAIVVLLLIVPPLVSISRYKSRVTRLVSTALRRPVRMSSVELRILPRPGFVLTDFAVQEDPAYGAEPVLHANTVRASIRLASLWRGKLQISRISVDEASLNLVHTPEGRWNAEALFATAASLPDAGARSQEPFPYMEATNSRINVKNGTEKLPYSLVNADASLWLDGGAWRVRLRGQPARTDVSLDLPDTGIVRVNGTLAPGGPLERMPLHIDLDWREAQLGQLTRLVLGSDEGWRGDLTGELHLDGNVEAAHVNTRLRAAGVHRVEFAPAEPLDFDAACSFVYHGQSRAMDGLLCNSPVGEGRVRLTGSMPVGERPNLTLEVDKVPAQAGLDMLRAVRRDIDESLQANGSVSGKMSYAPAQAAAAEPTRPSGPTTIHGAKKTEDAPVVRPLSGNLVLTGLRLMGNSLSGPIQVAKVTFEPAADPAPALTTTVNLVAGATAPVAVMARVGVKGFQLSLHGPASLSRLRDFARLAGVPATAMAELSGEGATLDLTSEGQWLPQPTTLAALGAPEGQASGQVRGSIQLKDATWKPAFLPNPVELATATLRLEDGAAVWDPVSFSYGPLKGTAKLTTPAPCSQARDCEPEFAVHFASLDAGAVEAALLGARDSGTLLSAVLAQLKASGSPAWPQASGTVDADTLTAGPFTCTSASAKVRLTSGGAEAKAFQARVLGGIINGAATLEAEQKPSYTVQGTFDQVSPQAAGQLLGQTWSGGSMSGSLDLTMSGFSDTDLSSSAKGTLRFDWRRGAVAGQSGPLARFDDWSGQASIGEGALTLGDNEVKSGKRKAVVQARAAFARPAKLVISTEAGQHGAR